MTAGQLHTLLSRCEGAYSPKTLSSYANDLKQFQIWCVQLDECWLPATPLAIAAFVDEQARSKAISTIRRRVEAIKFAHRMADLPSPVGHSEVLLALRRAARAKTARPRQSLGLSAAMLEKMVAACPDDLAGLRDAALLSVGYDTLCRSIELAAMRVEHLVSDLSRICVTRSKSDPFGEGRIAYLSPPTIRRVAAWLDASGLREGPLFCGLHTRKLSRRHLNTSSIRRIVKMAAARSELGATAVRGLSGHSMRVGAAQDMMVAGMDAIGIMQAGGWRTFHVLARYVENASAELMHQRRWQQLRTISTAGPLGTAFSRF